MHDGFLNKYSLVHRRKSYTLKTLTPRQVYDDQMQLQQSMGKHKESEKDKESERIKEKDKQIENPKEWKAGKSERDQAERGSALVVRQKESAALQKESCVTRVNTVRKALVMKQPMLLLNFKETCLNTNVFPNSLPSSVVSILQEFKDVFPEEIPKGLPPIHGIEHQIDFVPGASIPNK